MKYVFLKTVFLNLCLLKLQKQALGHYAMPIVAFILAISCLATAVVLATLFITDFAQTDISHNKLTRPQSIIVTLGFIFGMSLFVSSHLLWVRSILEWTYPPLLFYAILQIGRKFSVGLSILNFSHDCFYTHLPR